MWIETRILFSFGPLVVERALCARWKTRDGARVPPGISRARPLPRKNETKTIETGCHFDWTKCCRCAYELLNSVIFRARVAFRCGVLMMPSLNILFLTAYLP